MGKLKAMYRLMNGAAISKVVKENGGKRRSNDSSNGVGAFQILVCYAENIKPITKNGTCNPYVIIRVPEGTIVNEPSKTPTGPVTKVVLTGAACELVRFGSI